MTKAKGELLGYLEQLVYSGDTEAAEELAAVLVADAEIASRVTALMAEAYAMEELGW